jgi:hypothetical protein
MTRQYAIVRHFVLPLTVTFVVLISPAVAQQPTKPTPPPAAFSDPQTTTPKDTKDDPAKKPNEGGGKSKLEKETGTVNDRIFEVVTKLWYCRKLSETSPA